MAQPNRTLFATIGRTGFGEALARPAEARVSGSPPSPHGFGATAFKPGPREDEKALIQSDFLSYAATMEDGLLLGRPSHAAPRAVKEVDEQVMIA